jgi:hypothetical protein
VCMMVLYLENFTWVRITRLRHRKEVTGLIQGPGAGQLTGLIRHRKEVTGLIQGPGAGQLTHTGITGITGIIRNRGTTTKRLYEH